MKYQKGFTLVSVLLVVLGVGIIGGGAYYLGTRHMTNDSFNYSQLNELKIPENKQDNNFDTKILSDKQNTLSNTEVSSKIIPIRFPSWLNTYGEWPPIIQHSTSAYLCRVGHVPNTNDKDTIQKIINGRTYCVTTGGDGAAGSIYYDYTYTTVSRSGNGTDTIHFILRWMDGACADTTGSTPTNLICHLYEDNPQAVTQPTSFDVDLIVENLMR